MDLKLHANATTTPRIRAYIQKSSASIAALARELGIHNRTVARWKARTQVLDRSTRPHRLATTMTDWEEALIVELRRSLALPLDDITEAMRRCVNPRLSRSAIHRCLQRHAISARLTPDKAPAAAFQTAAPAGFIHIDVKYLPPLNRRRSYAYVAIDRATRFVYLEILPDRRAQTAAGFLDRFRASFPLEIHTILTDNGSEFTDRFAVNKKGKPPDKPSGQHPFDRLCARHAITHRLTRPFRPQTNGMVERFNRRLGDHLDRMPQNRAAHHRRFLDHAERDAYLHTFVADYNRTRLHCLDYHAPAELLAKLTGHNTQAGGNRGRDLILALAVNRILDPGSKLAAARALSPDTATSSLGEQLGLGVIDEDELYSALDWLKVRQPAIEAALAKRHFAGATLVLYDVSSSDLEGRCCPLGQFGYSRDRKRGKRQIVDGLLCAPDGCPVAIEVFAGSTANPTTLTRQVTKLKQRFALDHVVRVVGLQPTGLSRGDRGMIAQARITAESQSRRARLDQRVARPGHQGVARRRRAADVAL